VSGLTERAARQAVERARKRVARAEDRMQVALDERNEADEALAGALADLNDIIRTKQEAQ
jgi:hypothetical protein